MQAACTRYLIQIAKVSSGISYILGTFNLDTKAVMRKKLLTFEQKLMKFPVHSYATKRFFGPRVITV